MGTSRAPLTDTAQDLLDVWAPHAAPVFGGVDWASRRGERAGGALGAPRELGPRPLHRGEQVPGTGRKRRMAEGGRSSIGGDGRRAAAMDGAGGEAAEGAARRRQAPQHRHRGAAAGGGDGRPGPARDGAHTPLPGAASEHHPPVEAADRDAGAARRLRPGGRGHERGRERGRRCKGRDAVAGRGGAEGAARAPRADPVATGER